MNGWIKLHRQFLEWEWYSNDKVKSVFIHCLLMANLEDKEWRGVMVKRGSFISSVDHISKAIGLSPMSIRLAFNKLKSTKELSVFTTNQYSVVTVCKYEDYQGKQPVQQQTDNKPTTNEQQTDNKPTTTTKEVKKERIEEVITHVAEKTATLSGLHNPCIRIFTDWYKTHTGVEYFFHKSDAAAMKTMIPYLKKIVTENFGENTTNQNIVDGFKVILESHSKWSTFHQQQLKLTQIASNLPNIINSIKNGTPNGRVGKQPATSFAEIDAIVDRAFADKSLREAAKSNQ